MNPTFRSARWWLAGALGLVVAGTVAVRMAFALATFIPGDGPIGYVGQDDLTSYSLRAGNSVLFRGEYGREFWSGSLMAYPVTAAGHIKGITDYWESDAATLISRNQNFDTGRYIATMRDSGVAVAFRWDALSTAQQGALGSSTVLNFLRGERVNEVTFTGGTLRQRASPFGAVIHSRPYYVADAANPTVFVGANDGMLHAINAGPKPEGGSERWAYVPSMLVHKLKRLSDPNYTKDYFVDGQINIVTVKKPIPGTTPVQYADQRILVGGLGGGGKGLYALDITSLSADSESDVAAKVLWEITPTRVNHAMPATPNQNGYVNLGYTYGTMTLAKVNGVDAVIVGNGYNSGDNDTETGTTAESNYSGCNAGSPGYEACDGDFGSYLYIINVTTGQLISKVRAGTGTRASPNGLSTPVAVDSDNNGSVDTVYAGDLNGTMWKFSIQANNSITASALLVTNPVQPITSTPGVAIHPLGGYMINFATGRMLTTADTTDQSVHWVYGVRDTGSTATVSDLVTQTITARDYYAPNSATAVKVRRVTNNEPNWSGGQRGWKVALPAGERVVGEGSFIESSRFYFNAHNPTVANPIANTDTTVMGSNWQMELDMVTGGAANAPFMDLSQDLQLDANDRLAYISGDTVPSGKAVGDRIMTADGVPIGRQLTIGVLSQPVLVQMANLNDTLYNQNPDVTIPATQVERGVAGGHFDVEYFYGGTRAYSTYIKVGTSNQASGVPTTLGAITTSTGTVIVPALAATDLPNGFDSYTVATTIASRTINGFTGTIAWTGSGRSTVYYVRLYAPTTGTELNNVSINIANGTGSNGRNPRNLKPDLTPISGSSIKFSGGVVNSGDSCASGTARCVYDEHQHEYDDLYDRTGVNFLDPSDPNYNLAVAVPDVNTTFKVLVSNQYLNPAARIHIGKAGYRYDSDDGYVATKNFQTSSSLDMASETTYSRNSSAANYIKSLAINLPVDAFTPKNWWGGVNNLPADVRVGLMPTEPQCVWQSYSAAEDGNWYQPVIPPADVTATGNGSPGYAMANGDSYFNARSSTAAKPLPQGVRHNGALVVQIVRSSTTNSQIEMNIPARPEYGWRVKAADYASQVIAEYTMFWHTKHLGVCFGETRAMLKRGDYKVDAGTSVERTVSADWTKLPSADNRPCVVGGDDSQFVKNCSLPDPGTTGTDPKIGELGIGSDVTVVGTPTIVTDNNVTTTTTYYSDQTFKLEIRTVRPDGSVKIDTTTGNQTDYQGGRCVAGTTCKTTSTIIANTQGSNYSGGDEKGQSAKTGRISWRELLRN